MTTWQRHRGDVRDTITARLDGVENLEFADTVTATVTRGDTVHELAVTILDRDARTVEVSLIGWLEAPDLELGVWKLLIHVTFTNGSLITWPEESSDYIVVEV